jgi:hypothetical protein
LTCARLGGSGVKANVTQITELRSALDELDQYLSDRIPPLMVADSIGLLLEQPAALVAGQISVWTVQQQAASPGVPAADLLYHAVKKVAILAELDLLSKDAFAEYLPQLAFAVLPSCPETDRDLLRQSLSRLGMAAVAPSAAARVELLHRETSLTSLTPLRPPAPEAAAPSLSSRAAVVRRLSLYLERLQPQAAPERRSELASHFVAAAAAQSRSEEELATHLEPLREQGIEVAMDQIFRTLAGTLPGWGTLAASAASPAGAPLVGGEVNAMRQIVALAPDPAEGAKRFRNLVQAAVEQFNHGNFGRAVTMFELAEQLVAEQKVLPDFVDAVRQGHEPIHYAGLRKGAEKSETRPGLRKVMNFYYALRPQGLLQALRDEPRRERRHELLALLEAHEADARAQAFALLEASVATPDPKVPPTDADPLQADPFFQRNLVYLLRVIPRPADASLEEEVALVTRCPGRDSPPPLVKQVIAYLGQTRHDGCERALVGYLHVFENMLLQPETAVYDPGEIETLLDRTCAALARYASPRAWRALVDHGLKTEVKLGSPTLHLVEAGRQDLSSSPDLVERLIAALRAELQPKTLVGLFMKNGDRIGWLVQALAGTPMPEVREVLTEIAERHPHEKFGELARKAVASLGAASRPSAPAGLSGDLDLFGLPGLLQTLANSHVTGALSLMNTQGRTEAVVLLENGQYRGAQYKHLKAAYALYQLLEQPFPGTFAFVSRADVASLPPAAPARELLTLLLEGVRRHDELKRAVTLVPDDAVLRVTGTAVSPLSDEEPDLAHAVWDKVAGGSAPAQIEALITRDSYSIRRLIAHWFEEGALAPAARA